MSEFEFSYLNNYSIGFVIVMSFFTLVAPKRFAFLSILISACFITLDQRLMIFNLNITTIRILLFVGWLRVFVKDEIRDIKINTLDKIILSWVVFAIVSGVILEGTLGAFVNRVGLAVNSVGIYFLFRIMVNERRDVETVIKISALLIVPLAALMLDEYLTRRNFFSIFGGVAGFTYLRDGVIRCQGPFRHPILAGTAGATLVPLYLGLWFQDGRGRIFAIAGGVSATIIMLTSHSSGPLLAFLSGILWFMMWPIRRQMKSVKWAIFGSLVVLHMVMKAPVWALAGRISSFTGGTGWHREELIDAAITHFDEWWLVGTTYTKHWMYDTLVDPNMIDVTNQYIFEGINGGLIRLILFVLIISTAFGILGNVMKDSPEETTGEQILAWGLASALVSHVVSFLSVSYFDQNTVFWYLLLAMISAMASRHETSHPPPPEEWFDG
jgi:hypothetical protein